MLVARWILISVALGISAPTSVQAETATPRTEWSVVALWQDFDEFTALRIDSTTKVRLCKFNIGRLLGHKEITAPNERLSDLLQSIQKELVNLKYPARGGNSGLEEEEPPTKHVETDGTVARILYIEKLQSNTYVQKISPHSDLDNLIGLLLAECEQQSWLPPAEKGSVVWVSPVGGREFNTNPLSIDNPDAENLLDYVGAFTPLPWSKGIPSSFKGSALIEAIQLPPILFTRWRVNPPSTTFAEIEK